MYDLNGFGAFPPRVIYIKVKNEKPFFDLAENLRIFLEAKLGFSKDMTRPEMKPHMTVANKDLSKTEFHKAWKIFQEKPFEGQIKAGSLFLLKHNGSRWEIYAECPFRE